MAEFLVVAALTSVAVALMVLLSRHQYLKSA
jgi:hypothetical protein